MLLINLGLFIVSCLVLVIAGFWLVKSLSKISRFLRISEFVAAFLIMGIATSIPELFVGINAALARHTSLILGTVIGSNIADLTLVVGVAVLLARKISVEKQTVKKNAWWMIFFVSLPLIMMYIGNSIERWEGALLICVSSFYLYRLYKQSRKFTKAVENRIQRWEMVVYPILLIFCTLILFFSAKYIVEYGSLLALDLYLPPLLIGLIFVALGTSLPELVFGSEAVLRGHGSMVIGDSIGSVVINSTLILGIVALIYPITAHMAYFFVSAVFMLIMCFLFLTFVESGSKLSWKEGLSLLLFYVLFIIVELSIKGAILG